jgi:hypothetical protein
MVMIDKRAWVVGALPTPSQHPGLNINILGATKESARTKSLIETADRFKCRPPTGEISPVNQAGREKLSRTKFLSANLLLDGGPVSLWIVEENSAPNEPKSGVLFEAEHN